MPHEIASRTIVLTNLYKLSAVVLLVTARSSSRIQVPWGESGEREGIAVRHLDGIEDKTKMIEGSFSNSTLRQKH